MRVRISFVVFSTQIKHIIKGTKSKAYTSPEIIFIFLFAIQSLFAFYILVKSEY